MGLKLRHVSKRNLWCLSNAESKSDLHSNVAQRFCERLSLNPCFLNVDFKHMVLIMPSLLWGHILSCTIRFLLKIQFIKGVAALQVLICDRKGFSGWPVIVICSVTEMLSRRNGRRHIRQTGTAFSQIEILYYHNHMIIHKETATVMGLLFSSFETCIIIHRHLCAGVTLASKSNITKCVGY